MRKPFKLVIIITIFLLAGSPFTIVTANNWPKIGFDSSNTAASPEEIEGFQPWNRTLPGYTGAPAIVNNKIYVITHDSQFYNNCLYCLDAATGVEIWNYSVIYDVLNNPIVTDDVVYVSFGSEFAALNASTGQIIWKRQTSLAANGPGNVVDGVLYFGSIDKNVYALNASTGQKIWNYTTGNYVWYICPAVADGLVFAASQDKNIYALSAADGSLIWKYATGEGISSINPAVANGVVYLASYDQHLYALSSTTGTYRWRAPLFGNPTTSAVVDDTIYTGTQTFDSTIWAFNANGKVLWEQNVGGVLITPPAVSAGILYMGIVYQEESPYKIVALELSSGAILKNYTTSAVPTPPVISGGTLFIGDQYELQALNKLVSITLNPGNEATISPQTRVVNHGDSVSYTFAPKPGYNITHVLIDGKDKGAITSWNFSNVKEQHTISIVNYDPNITPTPAPTLTTSNPTAQPTTPKPTDTTPTVEPTTHPPQTTNPTPTQKPQTPSDQLTTVAMTITAVLLGSFGLSLFIYWRKRGQGHKGF